jgi:hypothetical protein
MYRADNQITKVGTTIHQN